MRRAIPNRSREGLRPWQAKRLFCTAGFLVQGQPAAAAPRAICCACRRAGFDPLLGRTYSELGLEARSMHKCQGTSQLLLLPGQSPTRTYRLTDTVVGEPGDRAGAHVRRHRHDADRAWRPTPARRRLSALTASLQAIGASVAAAAAAVAAQRACRRCAVARRRSCGRSRSPREAAHARAERRRRGTKSTSGSRRKESQFQEALRPGARHSPRGAGRRWHGGRGPAGEGLGRSRATTADDVIAETGERRRRRAGRRAAGIVTGPSAGRDSASTCQ